MDVFVLSSQQGVIGVYSTLNAAKNSVEIMVWDNSKERLFEAYWEGNPIYTINQMKLK